MIYIFWHAVVLPGLVSFRDSITGGHNETRDQINLSWDTSVHPCNDYSIECTPCYDLLECPGLGSSESEFCAWTMLGCTSGRVSFLSIPYRISLSESSQDLLKVSDLQKIHMVVESENVTSWNWLQELEGLRTVMLMLGTQDHYGQVASLPEWRTKNHVLEDFALVNANISGEQPPDRI